MGDALEERAREGLFTEVFMLFPVEELEKRFWVELAVSTRTEVILAGVVVGDPKIIRVRPGEHPEQYYVRGVRPGKTTIRVVNNNEFKGGAHAHVVDSVDIEVGY